MKSFVERFRGIVRHGSDLQSQNGAAQISADTRVLGLKAILIIDSVKVQGMPWLKLGLQ
jgi:hypothetical protein